MEAEFSFCFFFELFVRAMLYDSPWIATYINKRAAIPSHHEGLLMNQLRFASLCVTYCLRYSCSTRHTNAIPRSASASPCVEGGYKSMAPGLIADGYVHFARNCSLACIAGLACLISRQAMDDALSCAGSTGTTKRVPING